MPRPLTADEIESFREELCQVALRLFATHGFAGCTMRALAAELGCSPMTPYRYFDNQEEIFAAVRVEAFRRFGARVEEAARKDRDPIERLRGLSRAYVRFALEEPNAYRIMFQLDPPEAGPSEHELAVAHGTWKPLLETLDEAVETGALVGDPLTLAHLCWVTVHGLVSLELADRLRFERQLFDLVDPAIDSLIRGNRPSSRARPSSEGSCP